jgi:NADH-quinone oxidoreductase subunit F
VDLRISDAEPTAEERDAVDALLGPPASGWDGGARDAAADGRFARGGAAARAERHLLLPALHAVQDRVGWISEGALNHVCRRLTCRRPTRGAWPASTTSSPPSRARGASPTSATTSPAACAAPSGSAPISRRRSARRAPRRRTERATWLRSPCLGLCEQAPAALVVEAGATPRAAPLAPLPSAEA